MGVFRRCLGFAVSIGLMRFLRDLNGLRVGVLTMVVGGALACSTTAANAIQVDIPMDNDLVTTIETDQMRDDELNAIREDMQKRFKQSNGKNAIAYQAIIRLNFALDKRAKERIQLRLETGKARVDVKQRTEPRACFELDSDAETDGVWPDTSPPPIVKQPRPAPRDAALQQLALTGSTPATQTLSPRSAPQSTTSDTPASPQNSVIDAVLSKLPVKARAQALAYIQSELPPPDELFFTFSTPGPAGSSLIGSDRRVSFGSASTPIYPNYPPDGGFRVDDLNAALAASLQEAATDPELEAAIAASLESSNQAKSTSAQSPTRESKASEFEK